MICYVQYVDPDSNEVNTDFLFICNLLENSDSANSQTLFDVLCMKLNELQMDVKKISGLCTDGASVMVGKKDGLASKLKKENSSLIAVHCICHRLALACTDTNVKLKSIGNVEQIMLQLWKLFHYSPKKMALFLKHLQNYRNLIINTSIEEKCCKILKKACKTRWLSFDASIQAVWEELVPVVQTLSAISESDATAYGLLKRMNCTIFVGIVYILKEILPVLARVSKIFQRGYFNFSSIQPTLECAQGELQHISDNLTPIKNLEKDIQSDGRLGLLALELKDGTKTNLQHTLENYVQSLIDNISKRFPDVAILSALGIFNPVIIPDKKSTEFMNYGASSIETIFAHFYSNDEDITIDECLAEWNLLKYHLIKMKPDIPSQCELDSQLRTSTEWCLRQIVLKRHEYKHVCPHLANIAEIVLTVPVSNAWPERGCSKVKIIKTDLRNRLKNDVLNGLMMISINGPQTCSHECDKVVNDSVKLWLGEKNRRKLPSKNKGQVEMEMNKPSAHATPIDNVQIQLPTVHNEKPDNNSELEPNPNAYDDPELNEREIEKTLLQLKIVRSLIEAKTCREAESDSDSDTEFL
ncbi:zinc finger protein 862-like [Mytilus edulis]